MPTGYTAKLMEEGQTFPEFAMTCARAFGATISMRDDPHDKPIPKFEPSDYHIKALARAKAEYARLQEMGGSERIAFGEQQRQLEIERCQAILTKDREENERLIAMRLQVEAWTPPTPDHEGMKRFMLQQIDTSMNTCNSLYLKRAEEKAPVHYYAEAVLSAERDIKYHAAEHAKELAKVDSHNEWVQRLRESLI